MKKDRFGIRRTISLALFTALAYAVTLIFHIKVGFLTFDAKDTVVCIAGMLYGPVSAAAVSAAVAFLEFFTVSDTGFWGLIMNFVSTAAFSVIASLIYRRTKKLSFAVIGLSAAVIAETAVMLVMNIFITPIYMHVETAQVLAMIPSLLLPFNLIKSILNASLTMALYKPLSTALKKAGFVKNDVNEDNYTLRGRSTVVLLTAALIIAVCVLILIFVYDGKFTLI